MIIGYRETMVHIPDFSKLQEYEYYYFNLCFACMESERGIPIEHMLNGKFPYTSIRDRMFYQPFNTEYEEIVYQYTAIPCDLCHTDLSGIWDVGL